MVIPETGFDDEPMRPTMRLATVTKKNPNTTMRTPSRSLLPIPGPVDEAVLLLVAVPLVVLYREPLAEAWRRAERPH